MREEHREAAAVGGDMVTVCARELLLLLKNLPLSPDFEEKVDEHIESQVVVLDEDTQVLADE